MNCGELDEKVRAFEEGDEEIRAKDVPICSGNTKMGEIDWNVNPWMSELARERNKRYSTWNNQEKLDA